MMLYRMKSGFGAGIVAVMLILGGESIVGGRLDRDPFALLILLAGAWGASLPEYEHRRR